MHRDRLIACVASDRRRAAAAARDLAGRIPGDGIRPESMRSYLARPAAPARIILCAAGASPDRDLAFLASVSRRLLWPPPAADFREAIGGLRTRDAPPRAAGPGPRNRRAGMAAALLLEGTVGAARARAALESASPRDWIVESPRHVRIADALARDLERAGVRWSALEPVEVLAVYVSPGLARRRGALRMLLPQGTPVWVRDSKFELRTPKREGRSARLS